MARSGITSIIVILTLVVLTASLSGCTFFQGNPAPTMTVPTIEATATPIATPGPSPTVAATPVVGWDGTFVKLYGNISNHGNERVRGNVKIFYMDAQSKKDYPQNPQSDYDTSVNNSYSIMIASNVPFKVQVGYLYIGRLPEFMNTKLLDPTYIIKEDTRLDINIASSNITPQH